MDSRTPRAGKAFLEKHGKDPRTQKALRRVSTRLRLMGALLKAQDAAGAREAVDSVLTERLPDIPKVGRQELLRIAEEFGRQTQKAREDWQRKTGLEPPGLDIGTWEYQARLSGFTTEAFYRGEWSPSDIYNMVLGGLQKRREDLERPKAELPVPQSREEANVRVRKLLRANPKLTSAEIAHDIGRSAPYVRKLDAWVAVQKKKREQGPGASVRARRLSEVDTDNLSTGERDGVLNELTQHSDADQAAQDAGRLHLP